MQEAQRVIQYRYAERCVILHWQMMNVFLTFLNVFDVFKILSPTFLYTYHLRLRVIATANTATGTTVLLLAWFLLEVLANNCHCSYSRPFSWNHSHSDTFPSSQTSYSHFTRSICIFVPSHPRSHYEQQLYTHNT